jgi:hypothetical protein
MTPETCSRLLSLCPRWLWCRLPQRWRIGAVWMCIPRAVKNRLYREGETADQFIERMKAIARGGQR